MGVPGLGQGGFSFFKGLGRNGLAEKLNHLSRDLEGVKNEQYSCLKVDSGRADIFYKDPEVRVSHICSENIRACMPGAEWARGGVAGNRWMCGILWAVETLSLENREWSMWLVGQGEGLSKE